MPETLPPEASGITSANSVPISLRDKWSRASRAEKVFTVFISGSATLTLFTFFIGQFFSIRGVKHMLTSRIFLFGACLILIAAIWGWSWLFRYGQRWFITIVAALILLLVAVALDRAFPMQAVVTTETSSPPVVHDSGAIPRWLWIWDLCRGFLNQRLLALNESQKATTRQQER